MTEISERPFRASDTAATSAGKQNPPTQLATLRARERKRPQQPSAVTAAQGPLSQIERLALEVTYRPVEALRAAPRKARTHSGKQIAASIRQFGFVNPVLVDTTGQVVAGHGRLAAAKVLGIKQLPCLCLAHMTDEQLRAYRLADNRLAELAEGDEELLALELGELLELNLDFQIEVTGFETVDIDSQSYRGFYLCVGG